MFSVKAVMGDEERNRPGIFICAGEQSGDRYAAKLAERLAERSPGIRMSGIGGERMAAAGVVCHINIMKLATFGIVDAIRKLHVFMKLLRQTENILSEERPDAVVLIDNPGFNLRVAGVARKLGIPVIYYVSPQVWAWYSSRIKRIARLVDLMLVILPFETDLYRGYGVKCEYVGHPLLDYISDAPLDGVKIDEINRGGGRLVGLFPGSRLKEVEHVFPLTARAAADLKSYAPDVRFVVACARDEHEAQVRSIMDDAGIYGDVYSDRTFEVMKSAELAIATSGTAGLELCYFRTPMVVSYRAPSYARIAARWILKTRYISLVNIVAGTEVVPEFLLFNDDHRPIASASRKLLLDEQVRAECMAGLEAVMQKVGSPGASDRAAGAILEMIE